MPALSPYSARKLDEASRDHEMAMERVRDASTQAREQAVRSLQLYLTVLQKTDATDIPAVSADVQAIAEEHFQAVIADEVGCLDAVAAARGVTRQDILDAYAAHPGHPGVNSALQALATYVASLG